MELWGSETRLDSAGQSDSETHLSAGLATHSLFVR